MNQVDSMAREIVKGGFNAGDGYGEVWIRDYNTFIELAMEATPDSLIQDNLLTFFRFQGNTGDIVDGFIDIKKAVVTKGGGIQIQVRRIRTTLRSPQKHGGDRPRIIADASRVALCDQKRQPCFPQTEC